MREERCQRSFTVSREISRGRKGGSVPAPWLNHSLRKRNPRTSKKHVRRTEPVVTTRFMPINLLRFVRVCICHARLNGVAVCMTRMMMLKILKYVGSYTKPFAGFWSRQTITFQWATSASQSKSIKHIRTTKTTKSHKNTGLDCFCSIK